MVESLFISLTTLMYGSAIAAISAAFIWGVTSVILSPCHLGSIPLIVAFINGQYRVGIKKSFLISVIFSLGILISIGLIGLVTGLMGSILGDIGKTGTIIVIIVFIIIGLHFVGIIPLPDFFASEKSGIARKRSLFSAFLLGLLFGCALGPCTFAFMAPVLAVVFNSASEDIGFAISLVVSYAVGHSLFFIFFGTFSGAAKKLLKWEEKSSATKVIRIIKIIIGLIMVFTAIYMAYKYL
ncbi:MAG: cytochrome C biogenesis protein [Spirochaetes bacterium]|nr:cytochrome C biogenesis protein [Spirochaetota bacterium]MBN2770430.1 cytochrome C biogenesis protein [Spirochaetota bacterium]